VGNAWRLPGIDIPGSSGAGRADRDVYNADLPRPARNPPVAGPAYGVPVADFIRFLRQHGLDDRVDGYGIHIYSCEYSTLSIAAAKS
jgi:hypothetical protein